jgi:methylmalonyl-CoA/ethylmalonyl-CoA epimerase
MLKIEHIAIAVKNLQSSDALFSKLLNTTPYKSETVESEKVKTSFFKMGESKIELLEPIGNDGPISKFLEKKGEGLHHIALEVEDIYQEMERLKKEGFEFINSEPKKGADNKIICFLHPKSTNGVLIELCQEIK